FSVLMIVVSLFFIFTKGLNLVLDFTGGYQVQIQTSTKSQDSETMTQELAKAGFEHTTITTCGDKNNFLIKCAPAAVNSHARSCE
ncbi:protein translocase subunit SecF, partial [Francisella tularensis subsp. holarctica]|nr:protein translocase subunit SecF [Francisella tularensis subsp. holarctica]